jgi:hypothetical protein
MLEEALSVRIEDRHAIQCTAVPAFVTERIPATTKQLSRGSKGVNPGAPSVTFPAGQDTEPVPPNHRTLVTPEARCRRRCRSARHLGARAHQRRSDRRVHDVFDQTWTPPAPTGPVGETYRWRIDDVKFELTARNGELIRTRGRTARPAVIFQTTGSTLSDIVRGQISVTDAVEQGGASLKGSKPAVRRMFATIGFPLARIDS